MATMDVEINPLPAALKQMCARLRNRAELEGVHISRHDFDLSQHKEALIFLSGSDAPVSITLGNMRVRHTITMKSIIQVVKDGNTEDVADEAMDRAYAIERELQREFRGKDDGHTLVNDAGSQTTIGVAIGRHEWDIGWNASQRVFRIDFDLVVTADTTRTAA